MRGENNNKDNYGNIINGNNDDKCDDDDDDDDENNNYSNKKDVTIIVAMNIKAKKEIKIKEEQTIYRKTIKTTKIKRGNGVQCEDIMIKQWMIKAVDKSGEGTLV